MSNFRPRFNVPFGINGYFNSQWSFSLAFSVAQKPSIFPFVPEKDFRRVIKYNNSVVKSRSRVSQTGALNLVPKISFSGRIGFDGIDDTKELISFYKNNKTKFFYFPDYLQSVYVGSVSSGTTFIPLDITHTKILSGDFIGLYNNTTDEVITVLVDSVSGLGVTLAVATETDLSNISVVPLVEARFVSPPSIDYENEIARASFTLVGKINDQIDITSADTITYPQIGGVYVFDKIPLTNNQHEVDFLANVEIVGSSTNDGIYEDVTEIEPISRYTVRFRHGRELNEFFLFLQTIGGGAVSFYVPTFIADITTTTTLSSGVSSMVVEELFAYDGFMCISSSGVKSYHTVTSRDDTTGTITFSPALSFEPNFICGLSRRRISDGKVSLSHNQTSAIADFELEIAKL